MPFRFHALPSDDIDEDAALQSTSSNSDSSNRVRKPSSSANPALVTNQLPQRVPKMVLVDIDGVRMYYPSCFVALLVDEMSIEFPNTMNNNNKKRDFTVIGNLNGGFCAEDLEVEEILNASLNSSSCSGLDGRPLRENDVAVRSNGWFFAHLLITTFENYNIENICNALIYYILNEKNIF